MTDVVANELFLAYMNSATPIQFAIAVLKVDYGQLSERTWFKSINNR